MVDYSGEPVALESQISLCISTLLDAAEAAPQVEICQRARDEPV